MKRGYNIFLSLTILITVLSCKKNISVDADKSIIGTWELRQISAAMNPQVSNFPPGNGLLFYFDGSNYEYRYQGNILKSGPYNVTPDPTVSSSVCLEFPKDQFTHRIVYDNDTTVGKVFFQVNGSQLVLYSGCYALDAGQRYEYERVE